MGTFWNHIVGVKLIYLDWHCTVFCTFKYKRPNLHIHYSKSTMQNGQAMLWCSTERHKPQQTFNKTAYIFGGGGGGWGICRCLVYEGVWMSL